MRVQRVGGASTLVRRKLQREAVVVGISPNYLNSINEAKAGRSNDTV